MLMLPRIYDDDDDDDDDDGDDDDDDDDDDYYYYCGNLRSKRSILLNTTKTILCC